MKQRNTALGLVSGREAILAGALSILAGFALTVGPRIPSLIPVGLLGVLLAVAAGATALRSFVLCRRSIRNGEGFSRLGSIILGTGVILAVILPGVQLLTGGRQSRLEEKGFFLADKTADLALAWALFLLALIAFTAGEAVMSLSRGRASARGRSLRRLPKWKSVLESQWTYAALVIVGLGVAVLLPDVPREVMLEERGRVEGQGAVQLMGYALPLAISLAVVNRHWGSKWLALLDAALVVLLVLPGGTRTPLLIIGMAVVVRFMHQLAWKPIRPRALLAAALGLWLAATLLVGISEWRGNIRVGLQSSLSGEIERAAQNPFDKLWQGGLDTVDGLTLSTKVNRRDVDASWTDPAKIILGFIPHQLWPGKPEWLGTTVTQYYTNFEAGGIFLSGPGYLLIIFGSTPAIAFGFFVLGFLSEAAFTRMRTPSMATTLLSYFLLRFFFAGDAFDAFHVLGLALVLLGASGIGSIAKALLHRRDPRAVPAPG